MKTLVTVAALALVGLGVGLVVHGVATVFGFGQAELVGGGVLVYAGFVASTYSDDDELEAGE